MFTALHYEGPDGPSAKISTAEAAALLRDGTISGDTLVWTTGMDGWVRLAEVQGQFAGFESSAQQSAAVNSRSHAGDAALVDTSFEYSFMGKNMLFGGQHVMLRWVQRISLCIIRFGSF